jgi:hypothetical protein
MISIVDTTPPTLERQPASSKGLLADGDAAALRPIDAAGVSRYQAGGRTAVNAKPNDPHADRISREEAHWSTPRLLRLGFIFLGACLVFIYFIASI